MFVKKSDFDPERYKSAKKLKSNNSFEPFPAKEGDECYPNGIFEFNISKILEDIEQNPTNFQLVEIIVDDLPKGFSTLNESHIDSVDVSLPVILAEISPGRYNLIDGHHRMEKARRLGINTVSGYKLNVEQHTKYLTRKDSYSAYINYWNDKIKY